MVRDGTYLGRVQVLRFVAATSVLFAHLQHEIATRLPDGSSFRPFSLIDGGFGVDLFFVISGFIMYHVSVDKFGRAGATRDFLVRRYLRIAPLYYLATLLMLAATFAFAGEVSIAEPEPAHVLASFLFLPWPNALGEAVPVLKLGWTLNFEVYFYAMFALALSFERWRGLPVLALGLGTMVALAQVLPSPPAPIAFWGQPLVFEFAGGIAIAIVYQRGFRMGAPSAWSLIAGSVLLLVELRSAGLFALLPRAVFAGVPAWLIVLAVVAAPFDRNGGRFKALLVAGGEASYAIYVVHPFGIRAGTMIADRLGLAGHPWLNIALLMTVVVTAAFAVNTMVERPLDRWLRNALAARSRPRGEAPRAPV